MARRWARDLAPALVLAVVLAVIGVAVAVRSLDQDDSSAGPSTSSSASPSASASAGGSSSATATAGAGGSSGSAGTSDGSTGIDPSAIPSLSPCRSPRRLSVMTFNIHGGIGQHRVQLARIAAEIAAAQPDVVLLQEVDRFRFRTGFRDEPTILAGLTGMHAAFGTNVVRAPIGRETRQGLYGTAVLSRYKILSSTNTHLPNRAGMEQRGLLRVRISLDGQAVSVLDTHLQQTSASMRVVQIKAIRRLVAGIDEPVVLGGDFNSTPRSQVYRIAAGMLSDTWAQVGSGPGLTHPQRRARNRIDFLFHNDWLTPTKARVLRSTVSDHRAVWASYDVWGRAGCGN
ncbi:MAG: endonuclease/exonuclease/phosphatase family protein [Nocardioides sp.]|uniref:endonuclease/exonuclease/phosphatase family protein n=1 Tax=Nocardioides sp. TaxID=35761 RepID=UPI0039E3D303